MCDPDERMHPARRAAVALLTALALVQADTSAAADGGTGTYTVSGTAYTFDLLNSGSTAW